MKYNIVRTDKSEEQLREIIFYIADDSGSTDIALNYLDKIVKRLKTWKNFLFPAASPDIPFYENKDIRFLL